MSEFADFASNPFLKFEILSTKEKNKRLIHNENSQNVRI